MSIKKKNTNLLLLTGFSLLIGFSIGFAFQKVPLYLSFDLRHAISSESSVERSGEAPKIPSKLTFAGETVPLNKLEVRERLDQELIINTYRHSSTILLLKRAHQWESVIRKILKEQNIPEDFVYLCMAESNLGQVSSPSNASGFWQFLKPTAIQYGLIVNNDIDERFNVEKSTYAACQYLKDSYQKLGSWTLAAAGYNMGMTGISNQATLQKSNDYYDLYLNSETSRYLFRILALKVIVQNPQDFNFHLQPSDLYSPYEYREIPISISIPSWIDWSLQNSSNYKELKWMNPWIRNTSLSNSEQDTFYIKLPR